MPPAVANLFKYAAGLFLARATRGELIKEDFVRTVYIDDEVDLEARRIALLAKDEAHPEPEPATYFSDDDRTRLGHPADNDRPEWITSAADDAGDDESDDDMLEVELSETDDSDE